MPAGKIYSLDSEHCSSTRLVSRGQTRESLATRDYCSTGWLQKKKGCPIVCVQSDMFKTLPRLSHKLLWTIPFILECCQIVTILLSFFSDHSTTMTEAITIIQTLRSATGSGLLHLHHSFLKQIKSFNRDSQALAASPCRYTPFCSVPFCALNGSYAYTPETQPRARARAVLLRRLL